MNKRKQLIILIMVFIGHVPLVADVALYIPSYDNMNYYSDKYKKCINNYDLPTISLRGCMYEEQELQDKLLNIEYQKMMGYLSKARRDDLREAQRAWIKYRDANCNWYNDPEGGSSASVDASQCYLNMTLARLLELK